MAVLARRVGVTSMLHLEFPRNARGDKLGAELTQPIGKAETRGSRSIATVPSLKGRMSSMRTRSLGRMCRRS